MSADISCFYIHYNRNPRQISFIKFDNYFSVYLFNRHKPVIISNETLLLIPYLFQYYILSLLVTEKYEPFITKDEYDGTSLLMLRLRTLWKGWDFNEGYDYVYCNVKNLLKKSQPKRQSSDKKIRKFIKMFNREFEIFNSIGLIKKLIYSDIEYEKTKIDNIIIKYHKDDMISLLTAIKKLLGKDIYEIIRYHLIRMF